MFAALDSLLRRFVLKQRLAFWRGFGVWLVVVLAYFGLNYSLSGSPFPQTYQAKVGNTGLFAAVAAGNFPQLKGLLIVSVPSYFAEFCVHLWRANPMLAMLMHASYTGWLLVLYPATSYEQRLIWQTAFAFVLWLIVAAGVLLAGGAVAISLSPRTFGDAPSPRRWPRSSRSLVLRMSGG